MSTLTATHLSAGYGPKARICNVLQDINLTATGGEFIALIGPNGSGKSTLLKTLTGLMTPSAGTVTLDGKTLHALPAKTRAKTVAYLAQGREVTPLMAVEDVVQLARAPYRGPLGQISERGKTAVQNALTATRADALSGRQIGSLSGGEQARVLLARALAVEAPVLLADEPIATLDPFYQITMMDILKSEAAKGVLVIAALHDLPLAAQFADRIWVVDKGQLVADAPPKDVLTHTVLGEIFGIAAPKGGFNTLELAKP